jgi:hypothetical protein
MLVDQEPGPPGPCQPAQPPPTPQQQGQQAQQVEHQHAFVDAEPHAKRRRTGGLAEPPAFAPGAGPPAAPSAGAPPFQGCGQLLQQSGSSGVEGCRPAAAPLDTWPGAAAAVGEAAAAAAAAAKALAAVGPGSHAFRDGGEVTPRLLAAVAGWARSWLSQVGERWWESSDLVEKGAAAVQLFATGHQDQQG